MTEPSGLTFAVADLHGRRDLLDMALTAIDLYRGADRPGTVVFLGDYVDRGPQSSEILARLIEGAAPGWTWVCLKGNHEAMMSLALRNEERLDWWIGNGGDATIASYRDRRDSVARDLTWMDDLPTIHRDANRIYVHAGVDPAIPIDRQPEKTLLWKRYNGETEGHGPYHVVHGHDPSVEGPLLLAGRTDLDTLAWRTGRLVIGVFDDTLPGGPIDLIEIKGQPYPVQPS